MKKWYKVYYIESNGIRWHLNIFSKNEKNAIRRVRSYHVKGGIKRITKVEELEGVAHAHKR